jgi:malonate decarboxylase delta subunit
MERLEFALEGQQSVPEFEPILVGVVGSGNLEVLVEKGPDPALCAYSIHTSATGFGTIWAAVIQSFQARHQLGGIAVSINDMGATPAVVSLRLDQAAASLPRLVRPDS